MEAHVIDIYSSNDQYQLLQAIKGNRNKRHRQGVFFIEGVKAVNLALETEWPLAGAVCARERPLSGWAAAVLAQVPRIYRLPQALMDELSDREETSELMLLGRMQPRDVADIPRQNGLLLLLDRPASPGNLGTIIRSADAFCADGLVVSGHSADLYDPQTIRASVGTAFRLPVATAAGPACLDTLRATWPGVRLIGTSAKAALPVCQCDLTGPVVLLMGNETNGLSHAYKTACDVLVQIPIHGAASSLNLAAATSILLFEAQRQRALPG